MLTRLVAIKLGYDNGTCVDVNDHEEKILRDVVLKHAFCGMKFVPGEGSPTGKRTLDASIVR